jgi:hypothetical protein
VVMLEEVCTLDVGHMCRQHPHHEEVPANDILRSR